MGLRLKLNLVIAPLVVVASALMIWADYRHQMAAAMAPGGSLRIHALYGIALLIVLGLAVNAALHVLVLRPLDYLRTRLAQMKRRQWQGAAVPVHHDEVGQFVRSFQALGLEVDAMLRQDDARYRALVETTPDWVWTANREGLITFSNSAAARVIGCLPADLVGRRFVDHLPPQHQREMTATLQRLVEEGRGVSLLRHGWQSADGAPRVLETSAAPVFDGQGHVTGFCGVSRDLTQHLQLEDRLRQAERMETVGTLAGGIAHDFNNALTTILGFSDLLIERTNPSDPERLDLEAIRKAAEHSAALTRQLLAFSRRQILEPVVLPLGEVVTDVERMLRRVIGEHIELIVESDPDLGLIRADRGQIEQVVMNLAVNARDAMPDGGRLILETRNADLDPSFPGRRPSTSTGPHVVLTVSDTGVGMDAATQARMFEPFFTTKPIGSGTGLGLSTVYGIVQQSGGHIECASEVGRGTVFNVYLPRVSSEAEASQGAAASGARRLSGRETILVVEDDEPVRQFVRRSLEHHGYRVLEAGSAREAMARVASIGRSRIGLLLIDMVLPDEPGASLAARLVAGRSQLRVLFMSGYADHAVTRLALVEQGGAFLQKPFGATRLAEKVRQTLDTPPPRRKVA